VNVHIQNRILCGISAIRISVGHDKESNKYCIAQEYSTVACMNGWLHVTTTEASLKDE
jgi:hypothetical protein